MLVSIERRNYYIKHVCIAPAHTPSNHLINIPQKCLKFFFSCMHKAVKEDDKRYKMPFHQDNMKCERERNYLFLLSNSEKSVKAWKKFEHYH